jgi:hypothetical protein
MALDTFYCPVRNGGKGVHNSRYRSRMRYW